MQVKSNLVKTALLSIGALFAAGHALAADGQPNVYVGGAVGWNKTANVGGKIDGAWATQGFGTTTSAERTSTNPSLQLGYRMNRNLSIETTFDRVGNLGAQSVVNTPTADTASGNWKAHGVGIHALVSQPIDNKLAVYGRVGVERWHTSLNMASNTAGPANLATSSNNMSLALGAGASYALSPNVDATAELIHHNRVGDAATTGRASLNTVNMGLRYHFL
jgi:OmpA-OmpF porin, OOP family